MSEGNAPAIGTALKQHPVDDGIYAISAPRRFDGGEEAYDQSVGGANREDLISHGLGAWRLAEHHAGRRIQTWLEVGAGGGTCTLGLVAASSGATKIITDTSPVFLQLVRRKLAAAQLVEGECYYATLAGEDLSKLPAQSIDAIFVASAVHHVSDWREFIASAARALSPGGVLVMQEPFREGGLLMSLAMEIALSADWGKGLSANDRDKIRRCRDSIYLLANSRIEKRGEDKHNFLIDDMVSAAAAAGFSKQAFHVNAHFNYFAHGNLDVRQAAGSLTGYMFSFLGMHHLVSRKGIELLSARLAPILEPLDRLYAQGDGPALLACIVFTR